MFSDYVSKQIAKGRKEGNNHPVTSAVDAHHLILPIYNHATELKGNKFSLKGTELACVLNDYVTRCLEVGVPERHFRLSRLPVGVVQIETII